MHSTPRKRVFHVAEVAETFGMSLPAETLGEFRYKYEPTTPYKPDAQASDPYPVAAQDLRFFSECMKQCQFCKRLAPCRSIIQGFHHASDDSLEPVFLDLSNRDAI